MATNTNSGTHPCGEAINFTLFPDPIINLPQRCACLDHGNLVFDVDGDTLVIMTTASDFDLDVDAFGADYSSLDVRFCQGSDDE
ncbi:hypothetical protein CR513_59507, partial [Mucuna pruriens]